MGQGTTLAVWLDLQNHPLGSRSGENFNVAQNYQVPPARIYMVNHSRTRPWKRVVQAMSSRRGAEEVLIYDKAHGRELVDLYNVELLYRAAADGRDMNRYESEIKPVVFSFKCGGQTYAIPPAKDEKSPPPQVEVREGAWDLFLGNYDRMRGFNPIAGKERSEKPDPIVISEERVRLSVSWRQRHNPVFRYSDDGVASNIENEFGFIEFIRVTQKSLAEPIDKEYLTALDLVEV